MAKRLAVKHRKRRHDQLTQHLKGEDPAPHKVAVKRSAKHRFKNANRMV